MSLDAGTTTACDLGAPLGVAIDVHQGRVDGSRPFTTGHIITATGGHGVEGGNTMGKAVTGVAMIRQAVCEEADAGATLIELATCTGGSLTELGVDGLKAIVDEAH